MLENGKLLNYSVKRSNTSWYKTTSSNKNKYYPNLFAAWSSIFLFYFYRWHLLIKNPSKAKSFKKFFLFLSQSPPLTDKVCFGRKIFVKYIALSERKLVTKWQNRISINFTSYFILSHVAFLGFQNTDKDLTPNLYPELKLFTVKTF